MSKLTVDSVVAEIGRRLGCSGRDLELNRSDFLQALSDATRIYNEYRPRHGRTSMRVSSSVRRYTLSRPGLVRVYDVQALFSEVQIGDPFDPYLVLSPTSFAALAQTTGQIMLEGAYIKDTRKVLSVDLSWHSQNEMSGPNQVVAVYIQAPANVSRVGVGYTWHVTDSDDPSTGLGWVDPDDHGWFVDVAVARAKQVLGLVLRKFGGQTNSEGGFDPNDGEALVSEGRDDEDKLRERIKRKRMIMPPSIG